MAEVLGLIGTIILVVLLVLLVALVFGVWLVATVIGNVTAGPRRPRHDPRRDPAVAQLRYRYARGEISQAELEAGMRALGYEKVA
jgi:uncharacterized membrane protein